jgi:hypothetical protein
MADAPRHPGTFSTAALLSMCRSERLALEQRALILKRQLRERAAELITIEEPLDILHESEELLQLEQLGQPVGLRVVK